MTRPERSMTSGARHSSVEVGTLDDNPYWGGPRRDAWRHGYDDAASGRPSVIDSYTEIVDNVGCGDLKKAYAQGRRNYAGMQ